MSEYLLMIVAAIIAICAIVQFTREIRPSITGPGHDFYDDYDH